MCIHTISILWLWWWAEVMLTSQFCVFACVDGTMRAWAVRRQRTCWRGYTTMGPSWWGTVVRTSASTPSPSGEQTSVHALECGMWPPEWLGILCVKIQWNVCTLRSIACIQVKNAGKYLHALLFCSPVPLFYLVLLGDFFKLRGVFKKKEKLQTNNNKQKKTRGRRKRKK